jgi:hypothetical protein
MFQRCIDPNTRTATLRLLDITEMPVEVRRCISSFKVIQRNLVAADGQVDTLLVEVKLWNKNQALDTLARHKALLSQKTDDAITAKQLETMSDEELQATINAMKEKWDRHVAARARARLTLVPN